MKTIIVSIAILLPGLAFAKSEVLKSFKEKYPEFQAKYASKHLNKSAACNICHDGKPKPGHPMLNPYGNSVETKAKVGPGNYDFTLIEAIDSDEDKASNLDEITAGYLPGDSSDTPPPTK